MDHDRSPVGRTQGR